MWGQHLPGEVRWWAIVESIASRPVVKLSGVSQSCSVGGSRVAVSTAASCCQTAADRESASWTVRRPRPMTAVSEMASHLSRPAAIHLATLVHPPSCWHPSIPPTILAHSGIHP